MRTESMQKRLLNFFLTMLLVQAQSQSFAQFDDFPPPPPPDDFGGDDLPIPPPPPSNTGNSGPTGSIGGKSAGSSGTAAAEEMDPAGSISKKQKQKFAGAGIQDITNENFPETIESFDFPNVDIQDLVKAMSELTGKNFILDNNVRGKITIIAPSKITVAEAYKAFLSALAANALTIVPSGNFLKIKQARRALRDAIETYSGAYYPTSDIMITRVIHLKYISAEQVYRELRVLQSNEGELNPYPQTNSLILSDWGSNVDRVMKILSQLDVPGFEDQLEVIRVRYAKSKDIAELIDKIINKDQPATPSRGRSGGSFSSGVPRFPRGGAANTQSAQGTSYFNAFPDERTNSIIVTGNKAGIDRVRKLIQQLDFPISDESGGVYVYYVKYGDAEKIQQTLTGVVKDATPPASSSSTPGVPRPYIPPRQNTEESSSGTSLFGGDVKVTADKNTNSLVITASKQDFAVVKNLLDKIDIPRQQVYVETVIMEIKIEDSSNWNVGYYQLYSPSGKVGYNLGLPLSDILNPTSTSDGVILGFASGEISVKNPLDASGRDIKLPNLLSFISFLKKNSKTNILSTPQVLALDNQEAKIIVGQKVKTSEKTVFAAGGAGGTTEASFDDADTELTVKPTLSPGSNEVKLDLKLTTKQPGTASSTGGAYSVNIDKREIKTFLTIPDGDTAVLGGLIREDLKEVMMKVPLLGDLPLIGWLFKSKLSSSEKNNLLVFVTPKVLKNREDNKNIISKKLDQRIDFIKQSGGVDPHGKKLDEIVKSNAANNPGLAPSGDTSSELDGFSTEGVFE